MKKKFAAVVLLSCLLAACSSVPLEADEVKADEVGSAAVPPAAAPTTSAPPSSTHSSNVLTVPSLSALPDSAPRVLAGRFAAGEWSDLPDWPQDDLAQIWQVFLNNCKGLMRPLAASLTRVPRAAPRVWQPVCAAASQLQDGVQDSIAPATEAVRQFLQTHLRPWRVLDAKGAPASNTVTGYFEPVIEAARERGGRYQWPLYTRPDDLFTIDLGALYPELAGRRVRGKLQGQRVVPYDTRAQIAASSHPPPVIVWAADPVEAFFLQIQGSGQVRLPAASQNGTQIRLAYLDHNGHPYKSIGKWLVEQGEMTLAQASMQAIRAWAQQHPGRVHELLNVNPAVVFFREEAVSADALHPKGAYGIPLTAQRSIAVDADLVPLGTPVYLASTWPASSQPLRRLVFAQDTGAAIRGAARADFYWGSGDAAGALAGRMKQPGQMWVLWPAAAGQPTAR